MGLRFLQGTSRRQDLGYVRRRTLSAQSVVALSQCSFAFCWAGLLRPGHRTMVEGATLQGSNHKYTYHLALISMALRQRKADSWPETQVLALSQ